MPSDCRSCAAELVALAGRRDRRDRRHRRRRSRPSRRPRRSRSSSRSADDPVGSWACRQPRAAGRQRHRRQSASSIELAAKRLELLKRARRPAVTRVAVLVNPTNRRQRVDSARRSRAVAPSLGVRIRCRSSRHGRGEIERAFAALARAPNGGLIVSAGDPLFTLHRELIIASGGAASTARRSIRFASFVEAGGLMCYGAEHHRRCIGGPALMSTASSRARSPPTCRCKQPTKFELVINLKTAKALGLDVPPIAARPRRRGDRMIARRQFISLLGGAAAAWPVAARAQQAERMRRIGVLMTVAADDPEVQARVAAFLQGLQQLGWTDGRNVRIDIRWARGECRRHSQTRGGIGRARAGRHPGHWHADRGGRCCRRPAPCRSCSRSSSIRSAPASSRAWRGRAATSPASCSSNTA